MSSACRLDMFRQHSARLSDISSCYAGLQHRTWWLLGKHRCKLMTFFEWSSNCPWINTSPHCPASHLIAPQEIKAASHHVAQHRTASPPLASHQLASHPHAWHQLASPQLESHPLASHQLASYPLASFTGIASTRIASTRIYPHSWAGMHSYAPTSKPQLSNAHSFQCLTCHVGLLSLMAWMHQCMLYVFTFQ